MVAESRRGWWGAEGLVVALGIEGEFAQQRAVLGDNVDVAAGDQQGDGLVLVSVAKGDVAQASEVAQRHGALEVGAVGADARPAAPSQATIAGVPPRRGVRPRGATARAADPVRLDGQTTKSHALGDGAQRTILYLRRIVNQRQIPDEAAVVIEGGRITTEWSE